MASTLTDFISLISKALDSTRKNRVFSVYSKDALLLRKYCDSRYTLVTVVITTDGFAIFPPKCRSEERKNCEFTSGTITYINSIHNEMVGMGLSVSDDFLSMYSVGIFCTGKIIEPREFGRGLKYSYFSRPEYRVPDKYGKSKVFAMGAETSIATGSLLKDCEPLKSRKEVVREVFASEERSDSEDPTLSVRDKIWIKEVGLKVGSRKDYAIFPNLESASLFCKEILHTKKRGLRARDARYSIDQKTNSPLPHSRVANRISLVCTLDKTNDSHCVRAQTLADDSVMVAWRPLAILSSEIERVNKTVEEYAAKKDILYYNLTSEKS